MRSRERAIEDTDLRETYQLNEGREREIQIEEINLMDFTEIVVEQHIDINKGTETPREIEKEIGSRNDYEYGKDGKQMGQGVRKKNHKGTEINKEKEQRTIDDERAKENLKNKEDIELEAIEREIVREMREENKKMEERRKEVGIEKAIAEIEREAIDWEIMRDIREEEAILNNRLKEVGIERIIDEIGQRTEIRQEPRNRRNDTYQCREYVSEQIKLTNEEKPERIIIILTLTLTLVVYLPPSYQGHCPCSGGPF